MSVVTNIIVSALADDDDVMQSCLNKAVERVGQKSQFQQVDRHAGGNKAVETGVWLAAYNYFDTDGFIAALCKLLPLVRSEIYSAVQILVQEQDEDIFIERLRWNSDHGHDRKGTSCL